MVYVDLNSEYISNNKKNNSQNSLASIPMRILSFIIDYLLFTPVISFLVIVFFNDGVRLYKDQSNTLDAMFMFGILAIIYVFFVTFFQALFITFNKATPGQFYLKIYIDFEQNEVPIFIRAFIRQVGFAISLLSFGIPFLQILIDLKRNAFYEKITNSITRSRYLTNEKSYFHFFNLENDRRYWASSISVFYVFILVVAAISVMQKYQYFLTTPFSYNKIKDKDLSGLSVNSEYSKCQEFTKLKLEDRLSWMIPLNMVGVVSNDCLNKEADYALWNTYSSDLSLAYFAKFMTAEKPDLEQKYLKESCQNQNYLKLQKQSEGCYWSKIFLQKNYNEMKIQKDNPLSLVFNYELNEELTEDQKWQLLLQLQSISEFKAVKKFIILEAMEFNTESDLNLSQALQKKNTNRRPASVQEWNNKIKIKFNTLKNKVNENDLKNWIEDL